MGSFWEEQLNTKTVKTLSADDLNIVFNNVHIQDLNVESLEKLKLIKEVAGFSPGTIWKGTLEIKSVTLAGEGSDNLEIIHRPNPGEIWAYSQSSIEAAVFDTGDHQFRILTYDGSNYCCHVELTIASDSLVQEPILNEQTSTGTREGGFNNPIWYDYDNYLVTYYSSSGTASTAPIINTLVGRVN